MVIGLTSEKGAESMADITIQIAEKTLRIGTITIAGTILTYLFMYLWSSGAFTPTYHLSVYAPEVTGLTAGSRVLLDGLPVGTVYTVKHVETGANERRRIELVLRINKRYENFIRSDSTAKITTQGLLGNALVSIQRGFV